MSETTPVETGKDMLDKIAAEPPSLDRFFDRDPSTLSDEDIRDLIIGLRMDRTRIAAQESGTDNPKEQDSE